MNLKKANKIAVELSEHLTAKEQAFFVGGFQEGIKYLQQYSAIENILRNQINKGLPEIRHSEDGSVNVVLAVYNPKIYAKDGSNSYIPAWTVSNTEYYHKNPDTFLGWIDLEDLQHDKYK